MRVGEPATAGAAVDGVGAAGVGESCRAGVAGADDAVAAVLVVAVAVAVATAAGAAGVAARVPAGASSQNPITVPTGTVSPI